MFRKKVKDVIRKLDISNDGYEFIVSNYGDRICNLNPFGPNLDYYNLYKLRKNSYIMVIQDLTERGIFDMDPFSSAIVISSAYRNNRCKIHRFYPSAFTETIVLDDINDIEPNFEVYNVFWPDGSKVNEFKELKIREEFFAISKNTFSGRTSDGWFPENHPIHMMLRYEPSYLGELG